MLKKRKIDLSIMESTDQITADKMSIRPSEIVNLRYSKNKEAKKRLGLNRYSGVSTIKALGELNGSCYAYTNGSVYGINDLDEGVDVVTYAPLDNWSVEKLGLTSGNGAIGQVALARGENYFFYSYHISSAESASGNDICNTYLLDDNFNVVKDLSSTSNYPRSNSTARSIRAVSYDQGSVRYVDFVYINSFKQLEIARYDDAGDFVTKVVPYSLSLTSLYGGVEVVESHDGDGYWVVCNTYSGGANYLRLVRYTASTDSWSTAIDTTSIANSEIPSSIVAFSDKLVVTIGTVQDATGFYGDARVWIFSITSFPTAPKTILTYALAGYYANYAVATKVDDTYYMLSINEFLTSSGSTAGNVDIQTRILQVSKTATSVTSSNYARIGRTTAIGQCIIDGVYFYQMVMCQNGYYPVYYLIRGVISSSLSDTDTILHFLPARAPIYPAYYNGTVGDNDYPVNAQQALMRVQPYMVPFNGSWYSYVPVQSIGEENASWQSIKITKDVPVKVLNVKGIATIARGSLSFFDGVEGLGGAVKYPEIVAHSGGSSGSFTYAWVAVVKRTDGAGNVVRSLPSPPRVVTGLAAIGFPSVTLNFSPKALLWEDGTSLNKYSDSVVEIYRTEANGTVFYKEGESNAITFQSSMADGTLIGRELLYTTGDTLANVYPPAANDLTYAMGRVWVVGDDETIYYSKELYSGQAIEFNDGLLYRIDGGRNTSIARSGKRVIVFKQRQTFMIWGTPANNIGLGEALDHQEISSSIGAVSPVATVETEVGVIFESEKGLYIVRSNNALEFIGADVVDYTTNANITSSTHIEDLNEAVFTLDDGKVLIYNYLFGIWQVLENGLGASFTASARIGNRDLYADTSGYIYKSKLPGDSNPYQDESSNYKVRYSTGWLKVSEVGGFQRCYRLYVLGGKATTAQDIIVKVYNDYDDVTPTQTKTFAIAAGDPLNFELHIKQQKCESIRFTLEEDTNIDGGYIELNGLSIQVGIKQGFNKLSPDLRR